MSVDRQNHDEILSDALKLAESDNIAAATDALRSALDVDFRGEVAGLVSEFEQVLRTGQGAALAVETLRLLVNEAKPVTPVPRDRRGTSTLAELKNRLTGAVRNDPAATTPPGRQEAQTMQALPTVEQAPTETVEQEARWMGSEGFDLSESSSSIFESFDEPGAAAAAAPSSTPDPKTLDDGFGQPTPFGFADARDILSSATVEETVPRQPSAQRLSRSHSQSQEGGRRRSSQSADTPRGGLPRVSASASASSKQTGRMTPVGEPESKGLPVSAILEQARQMIGRGDLASALDLLNEVLSATPEHSEAKRLHDNATARIGMLRMSALEPLDRSPRVDMSRVATGNLTPQSMFVVSLADGTMTLRDLIDMSGLSRAAAAHIICDLLDAGVLKF